METYMRNCDHSYWKEMEAHPFNKVEDPDPASNRPVF